MGKGKKLLILLVVVALLVGGYFAAMHFLGKEDAEDDDTQESESVSVAAMHTDDVVSVKYVCGDETIELVKDGDTWRLKSDPDFPVNQAYADTMAADAADLSALRLVSENASDFAEYGLSEPETAYIFGLADGSAVTYFIGNYNSFGGTYYMNVAGTNKIYLISGDLLDDFAYNLSDLADVEAMQTVPTEDVKAMRLTLDGETIDLFYAEHGLSTVYSDAFTWFFDKTKQADSLGAQSFIGKAVDFRSTGCAAYKADEAALASFGLDNPVLTAKFDYVVSEEKDTGKVDENEQPITETVTHDESLTLCVGGASKDGSLYAKTDASDAVYLIEADYLQTLRDFDRNELRDVQLCMVQTADIASMDVTIGGKTSHIVITRTKADTGSDSIVYTLDGRQITAVQFNDFYTAIQSVKAEAFAEQDVPMDDATITVVYHTTRKGFETVTLRLMPYDQSFYAADRDGDNGLLINKRSAEKIISTFNDIREK